MAVSREVQAAVDKIREERNALAAAKKANELQAQQLADLKSKVDALEEGERLSAEDKQALVDAVNEASETNDAVARAVPQNVDAGSNTGVAGGVNVAPTPPEHNPDAPRPDPIAGTGQNGSVPLMPNMAFDPRGGTPAPAGASGQPEQAAVIPTAGGFVVSGGGSTARAPGSRPDSPSSSMVVPEDPNAKAPVSTADEVKSGLGDSSQNALKGADGRPVSEGPGIQREPSPEARQAEQDRLDKLDAEMTRRQENPLNLSDEDLAKRQQADKGKGSPDDPGNSQAKDPAAAQQPQSQQPQPAV